MEVIEPASQGRGGDTLQQRACRCAARARSKRTATSFRKQPSQDGTAAGNSKATFYNSHWVLFHHFIPISKRINAAL